MDLIAPTNLTLGGLDNTTMTPSSAAAEGDFLEQLTKRCPTPPCIFSPQPSLTLEFLDTLNSAHTGSLLVVLSTLMAMVSLYVGYMGVYPNH